MKRLAATACLTFVLTSSWGGPALALCVAPPPLGLAVAEARTVFVGRVTETTNDDRWATVEVSEVWKGDVGRVVEVRGGPEDPPGPMHAASSIDRSYREGATYLFLPSGAAEDDVFLDDSCSSTTRFSPRLEHLRPAGAARIDPAEPPEPSPGDSSSLWWASLAVGAGAVSAGAWVRRRRAAA